MNHYSGRLQNILIFAVLLQWGTTPLIKAAGEGHFDTVKLLIERGAAINAKESVSVTPLHAEQFIADFCV